MDRSVCERLVQDDVTTLGYFPAEGGVYHLVLVSGRPHLATVDTVPLTLEPLSEVRFFFVAARLLDEAMDRPGDAVVAAPEGFPEALRGRAHDLRVWQQLVLGR